MSNEGILADVLAEFLEVAFHAIIYLKNIYPKAIYENREKYNVPVKMSTHPQLNGYIGNCILFIRKLISHNALKQVAICFLCNNDMREKIVFEFSNLRKIGEIQEESQLDDLAASFRAFCMRIYAVDNIIEPIPSETQDCRFTIRINAIDSEVEKLQRLEEFKGFSWVDSDADLLAKPSRPKIFPLKSLKTDFLFMQLYVEQLLQ